jgi:hypothetical protein
MGGGTVDQPPQDQPAPPEQPAPSDQNAPAPETPETPAPSPTGAPQEGALMQGLDAIGIGNGMQKLGLNIGGYIDMGYLYDFTVPKNLTPPNSAPGDFIFFPGPYKNQYIFDQIDLELDRKIDASQGKWDVGFEVEGIYGRDAFFTHSNGILDNPNKNGGPNYSSYQPDLLQAYVDFAIPVGNGLTVKAGKMVSPFSIERIDPTANLFYTHSYIFGYGVPYTQTGITAQYILDNSANSLSTITAGITRGWNQSTDDNNGVPDGILQFTDQNGAFNFTGNLLIGPEGVLPYGPPDNSDWWVVPEAIFTYKASDQMTLSGDILYGDAPHLTQWFGAAGYIDYKFSPMIAGNLRLEFYHDGNGVTTGVGGGDVNYFEATFGAAITPLPDSSVFNTFAIRPEIRVDTASQPVYDGSHWTQLTAAIDLVYRF